MASLADASGQHHDGKAVRGDVVYDEGKVGKAADFSGETQVSFGNTGDFDRGDRFALALWARTASTHPIKLIQKRDSREQWQGYGDCHRRSHVSRRGERLAHFVVRLPPNGLTTRSRCAPLSATRLILAL